MSGNSGGHTPVRRSIAKSGEMATPPTDGGAIWSIEITDTDGQPVGRLIEWLSDGENTWMWAAAGSYEELTV